MVHQEVLVVRLLHHRDQMLVQCGAAEVTLALL